MTFLAFTLIIALIDAVVCAGLIWWYVRHPDDEPTTINLALMVGLILAALCPIINVIFLIFMIVTFFIEVAPKIMVIGRGSNG